MRLPRQWSLYTTSAIRAGPDRAGFRSRAIGSPKSLILVYRTEHYNKKQKQFQKNILSLQWNGFEC